jgi:hypothetical protein
MFGRLRDPHILTAVLPLIRERVMMRRQFCCRTRCFSLILLSCLMAGCANWSSGPVPKGSSWTERWRAGTTQAFGVDKRAREIEKNLGVD